MARGIWHLMGGGSIDPSELTAEPWAVLAPYTAGMKGMDEPGTGTMVNHGAANQTLNAGQSYTIPAGYHNGGGTVTANGLAGQTAGTAVATDIVSGKTAWVNGAMLTGAMAVHSVVSFSLAAYSTSQMTAVWQWPSKGPYGGVIIRYKEGSYPVSVADGTQGYKGTGTSYAPGSASSAVISGLRAGVIYYFRIWVYVDVTAGTVKSTFYSDYQSAAGAPTGNGTAVLTGSGIWTVPAGVRTLTKVFLIGGGAGGQGGKTSEKPVLGGNGGGSGYVTNISGIAVSPGQQIAYGCGAGGSPGAGGGNTTFGVYIANGAPANNYVYGGGKGGSGGGGGTEGWEVGRIHNGGAGGSNGGNGGTGGGPSGGLAGGAGAGISTIGPNGVLYGGGGGGGANSSSSGSGGSGGAGGGGNGGRTSPGGSGTPNTGSGGGGGGIEGSRTGHSGGSGGSGVIIVQW
ncbi:MAG: hypothetical protein HFG42_04280 [Lachnospiraceae bacterium]|jgi:hypothetical protein|nr:hypothetical protein [Lachnospiraceae bacterium]